MMSEFNKYTMVTQNFGQKEFDFKVAHHLVTLKKYNYKINDYIEFSHFNIDIPYLIVKVTKTALLLSLNLNIVSSTEYMFKANNYRKLNKNNINDAKLIKQFEKELILNQVNELIDSI